MTVESPAGTTDVNEWSVPLEESEFHVESREVLNSDGSSRIVHSVDVESPTFGKDLEHVFRLNVAKARRENQRVVGVADFVPRKN